jgi:glycosyltransferase involved in cell wall biosynthesis
MPRLAATPGMSGLSAVAPAPFNATSAVAAPKVLLLSAGRFDQSMAAKIAAGREPRLDVFELQRELGAAAPDHLARSLDHGDVERCTRPDVRAVHAALGPSVALAYLGVVDRQGAEAYLTSGEDIGLPLAMLLKLGRVRASHTMIAHTLAPLKKRLFFRAGVQSHLDRVLCYSSLQERLMRERLGLQGNVVERMYYHADEHFFRPQPEVAEEPDLICSAGQLLRDYDTLMRATADLGVRVHVAAGSPWIQNELRPSEALPAHVDWRRYDRFDLRRLYARSALAVVPIVENDYQTGISTILEMMAMGKCVVATRTRGQTDTIVDNVNGVYVPPHDPAALRATIARLLAAPEERARIGRAARAFIEKEAGLDRFVERVSRAVREGHQERFRARL